MDEEENDKLYIETIKVNGVYNINPDSNFMAMKEVVIDVRVPTTMEPVDADVRMVPGGLDVSGDLDNDDETQDTNYIITHGQRTSILESTQQVTVQRVTTDTYQSMQSLNSVIEQEEHVQTTYNAVRTIIRDQAVNVNLDSNAKIEYDDTSEPTPQRKRKRIGYISSNNINNLISTEQPLQIEGIIDANINMTGNGEVIVRGDTSTMGVPNETTENLFAHSVEQDIENRALQIYPRPNNHLNNNKQNNQNNSRNNIQNKEKKVKTSEFRDISEPNQVVLYNYNTISVDDINRIYNTNYYGMFEVEAENKLRFIDGLNLNVSNNNSVITWNIEDDYINASLYYCIEGKCSRTYGYLMSNKGYSICTKKCAVVRLQDKVLRR